MKSSALILSQRDGFAPAGSFPGRFGLKTMQERAQEIGATWEIASDAGRGTQIRVRLPLGERGAHPPDMPPEIRAA